MMVICHFHIQKQKLGLLNKTKLDFNGPSISFIGIGLVLLLRFSINDSIPNLVQNLTFAILLASSIKYCLYLQHTLSLPEITNEPRRTKRINNLFRAYECQGPYYTIQLNILIVTFISEMK